LHLQPSATPVWYSDLSSEQQAAAWADLDKTSARRALTQFPDFISSDVKIPKTYISTENDVTLVPDFQNMFIQTGGFTNVIKIPTGHAPMLSAPDKLVEILVDVAGKA
jgi:pimeloyl-ACP methyl ester carboxylesterase